MRNLTIHSIAKACGGEIYDFGHDIKTQEAKSVVIDSRLAEEGSIFIATKGERVDGHSFIDQVFDKGALAVICEVLPENCKGVCIKVNDSFQALKDIALFYRNQLDLKIVGVTGSVGKTTTKEMIAKVLSEKYSVLFTQGNFNNEIGVPLTLLRIRDEHEAAVVEMGINSFGEMTRLTTMVKPDICVITNIGVCHLEKLIDRDGVLRAKTEIFSGLSKEGFAVLCGDDDKLITVKEVNGKKPVFFSYEDTNADYYADNILDKGLLGSSFMINGSAINSFEADIRMPGKHMISNALAATAVGKLLDMKEEEIQSGLSKCRAMGGRNEISELDGMMVIDDCYNANPTSTKAGIDLLMKSEGKKVAILGDMLELGEFTDSLHAEVGKYAIEKGVDSLVCIGPISKNMYEGAKAAGGNSVFWYETVEEACNSIKSYAVSDSCVLIKASHGMHLEKVLEKFKEEFGK